MARKLPVAIDLGNKVADNEDMTTHQVAAVRYNKELGPRKAKIFVTVDGTTTPKSPLGGARVMRAGYVVVGQYTASSPVESFCRQDEAAAQSFVNVALADQQWYGPRHGGAGFEPKTPWLWCQYVAVTDEAV